MVCLGVPCSAPLHKQGVGIGWPRKASLKMLFKLRPIKCKVVNKVKNSEAREGRAKGVFSGQSP